MNRTSENINDLRSSKVVRLALEKPGINQSQFADKVCANLGNLSSLITVAS